MLYPDEIGAEAMPGEAIAVGLDSVSADAEPVIAIAVPKFCSRCGSSWDAQWLECQPCMVKKQRPLQPLTIALESRAIKSSLWLYMTLLAICMIGLISVGKGDGLEIELVELVGISSVVLIWCLCNLRPIAALFVNFPRIGWYGLALGLSLVTYFIGASVIHGFNHLMHYRDVTMSGPFLRAGYGWGFVVLCICVQPAVFEELAFRGVIFGGLLKTLSRFETVMVSALMFMILHLSPARFPHTLALGIAAGYLRLRTKSLYPCMLLHFSHNFMCVLMEWAAR